MVANHEPLKMPERLKRPSSPLLASRADQPAAQASSTCHPRNKPAQKNEQARKTRQKLLSGKPLHNHGTRLTLRRDVDIQHRLPTRLVRLRHQSNRALRIRLIKIKSPK